MAYLERLIAKHPISGRPYCRLTFEQFDHNGIPLYRVQGSDSTARGASDALAKAFEIYGGKCFYCRTKFDPQPLSNGDSNAHRDHVVPTSKGGSELLHNLVIACGKCGHGKGADPIHDFRPRSAKEYLDALNKHIAACLQAQPTE